MKENSVQPVSLLISVIIISLAGIFYPAILPWAAILAAIILAILLWQRRTKGYNPKSKTYKTLEKIRKEREKKSRQKHTHINDQIAYIQEYWGYTKEQQRIIDRFLKERAYSEIYNKLTASLLPQIITLIDLCNARERKGCKRDISRRITQITVLMKEELKKRKSHKNESFETTLEVYDRLLKEIKH
jgi:nitrogen fixation-related uncharacterized protein